MYEIKRIKILSAAKIGALVGGLPMIIFFIFLFAIQFFFRGSYYYSPSLTEFGQLILIIVFSVLGGFLWGALSAFIYNIMAERIGGIEIDIVLKEEKKTQ